jgi:predicted signal transduction protein with EAL and GGDEF domain
VALVAAAAFLPVAEPREVDATVTFLVRAGVMLTILAFAVSFRRSHDWQSAELERLATTDALTGLSNRIEFDRALEQALGQAARFGRRGALIFVDAMYEAKRAGGNQIFEHAPEGPRGIA